MDRMKTSHLISGLGLGMGLVFVAGGATGCASDNHGAAQAKGAGHTGDLERAPSVSASKSGNHRDAIEAVKNRIQSQVRAVENAAASPDKRTDLSGAPVVGFVDPSGLTLSTDARPIARRQAPAAASPATAPAAPAPMVAANGAIALEAPGQAAARAPSTAPAHSEGPQFISLGQSISASTTNTGSDNALTSRLLQHVQEFPTDLAGHLDLQLMRFLRDETVPQLEGLSGLSSEDREILSALLDGLSNFRTGLRADPNQLNSRKVRPLLELADRIRGSAELTVPTVCLCSEVRGFGQYEPMDANLKSGQDNPAILYCEVENFSSQQNDKLLWETKLSQEVVLYTETGFPVWRDKGAIPVDQARNRRHDFYVYKRITLPKTLAPGRYVLKVSIVDEQAKRVAENSLTINVGMQ
jgi:hypothetical protein